MNPSEVFARSLTELGCSLVINTFFYKYTNSPKASRVIFGSVLVQTVFNTFLRWNADNPSAERPSSGQYISESIPHFLCPNLFALLTGVNLQRLLHEGGHALASIAVFENAKPIITLFPYGESETKHASEELTIFGKQLGKRFSLILVAAAGPAASLLVSTIAMVVGRLVETKFQELGSYLIAYGRIDFFSHASYALSAMFYPASETKHDFVLLSSIGVYPLVASVALFAVPLLLEFGLKS